MIKTEKTDERLAGKAGRFKKAVIKILKEKGEQICIILE